MSGFIAFTKKEYMESIRTYRFIILLAVLLFFAILSPLTAILLPEILNSLEMVDGFVISLPEPSAMDSWGQFFSNIGQMGMLAVIIIFSGTMARDLENGTLVNLLTKGMKRYTVVISKFVLSCILWTIGYAVSLAVCYAYTAFYFPADEVSNAFFAFSSLWLYGIFLITLLIFGGTLFGNFYGSLFSCFGVVVTLALINISPIAQKYNPISLGGDTLALLSGQKETADFLPAMIICSILIIVFLVASIFIFNKKKV